VGILRCKSSEHMGKHLIKHTNRTPSWPALRSPPALLCCAISVALTATVGVEQAYAAIDYRDTLYRDTLEKAVDPPGDIVVDAGKFLDVFAADQESYDNNLFRLNRATDVTTLIGPNASRQDHINTVSAGLDGQWTPGRQIVTLDLRVDDNRYAQNNDLNNVSSSDRLIWNWSVGSLLSGQAGADFTRSIAGFVNSNVYSRNLVDQAEYFAGARYQIGPHWAIFGGIIEADTSLTAVASKGDDSNRKSGEGGVEYATSAQNSFGFEYRYTDATYPNTTVSNGAATFPNYHEDRERFFIKYGISDKTQLNASAGYLNRDYPNHSVGAFSGNIWRASLQWQPRDRTQIVVGGWRELHAYLTADSDYYVSNGFSASPVWLVSEKVNISMQLSSEKQNYIASSGTVVSPTGTSAVGPRQDKLVAEQAVVTYAPLKYLTVNLTVRHEQRNSNAANEPNFSYNDTLASVGVTGKF
jgi:exopolysaccharide biosynthesis operon protein EpsL